MAKLTLPSFVLIALAAVALLVASCSGSGSPCGKCGTGTACNTATGECVVKTMTSTTCVPGCYGDSPICDASQSPPACATCTATMGCTGLTPACDTTVVGGRCVGCVADSNCESGHCTLATQTCVPSVYDAGHGNGGGTNASGGGSEGVGGGGEGGGGTSAGGGTSSNGGGISSNGGGAGGGGGFYIWDGGAYMGVGSCAPQNPPVQSCTPNCHDGFHCENGSCILNGGNGPVQVTLRWNSGEDLDLHVREPEPDGGICEIYYGDPNNSSFDPSSCGATGSLDLDSNAGCSVDNVDIENVIYPPGVTAPRGMYSVYIDYYLNCEASLPQLPFEVEVRVNGMDMGVCGAFVPTDSDWSDEGGLGNGRFMMSFIVP